MIGIYAIVHKVKRTAYIGSSFNVESRLITHRTKLNKNYHHCSHLQNAWNKYGESLFEFKILAKCNTEQEAHELEKASLDCFFGKDLYNTKNAVHGVGSGRSHPNKGRPLTEEHKRKVSESMKGMPGRPHNEDTKKTLAIKSSKYTVITPDGVFNNLEEAAKFYNVSAPTIKTWASKKDGWSMFRSNK